MIARSIRARLTAWNGAILAAFLLAFAGTAYEFLRHATISQVDSTLRRQAELIGVAIRDRKDFTPGAPDSAIVSVLRDWRSRGVHVMVLDPLGRSMSETPIR